MGSVKVFIQHPNPPKIKKRILSSLSKSVIETEKLICGSISIVLTDNEFIKEINQKFLNHNYETDVISFRLNEGNLVDGELYISLDMAENQSKDYKVSFENELARLVAHGSLHLCGYDDQTDIEKKKMTSKENFYLKSVLGSVT